MLTPACVTTAEAKSLTVGSRQEGAASYFDPGEALRTHGTALYDTSCTPTPAKATDIVNAVPHPASETDAYVPRVRRAVVRRRVVLDTKAIRSRGAMVGVGYSSL